MFAWEEKETEMHHKMELGHFHLQAFNFYVWNYNLRVELHKSDLKLNLKQQFLP